jgi:hypothetical protein
MAVQTSIGPGFNVGTDAVITIADDQGDSFPAEALSHIMEFDSESEDTELKIVPISGGGVPIHMTIWSGVRGRMMFTRVSGAFQAMILELMSSYYNAGLIPIWTIYLTVMNRTMTIDEYIYTGTQFSRPRFGNFRATKEVDMQIEFRSGQCQVVAGATPFLGALAA